MKKILLIYLIIINFGINFGLFAMEADIEPRTKAEQPAKKQKTESDNIKNLLDKIKPKDLREQSAFQVIKNILNPNIEVKQIDEILEPLPLDLIDYIKEVVNKTVDSKGNTLLHKAGTAKEVQKLLSLNADPMAKNDNQEIPFISILKRRESEASLELLKHMPNLEENALLIPETVSKLSKYIDIGGHESLTPDDIVIFDVVILAMQADKNKLDLLKSLENKGIKNRDQYIQRLGEEGRAIIWPIQYALAKKKYELIPQLLNMGYSANKINPDGENFLMIAIEKNAPLETINLFINNETINHKNNQGFTPLMYAIYNNNIEAAKLLLEKGANINESNDQGNTALMLALFYNNLDMIRLLLQHNADVNISTNQGITTLTLAAVKTKNNIPEIIKLLLDNGANINAKSSSGHTTLMFAVNSPEISKEMILALISNGADVNAKDNSGRSVLSYAQANSNPAKSQEIIPILLEHGATQ